MKRWAALLRGVNVGGRKLPMADLRKLCEDAGFEDPKTLLASGNVVFSATGSRDAIVETLEKALADYGLKTLVMLRDKRDLEAAIEANPFPGAAKDHPNHLLLVFHRDPVPAALLKALADSHDGPERLEAKDCDLYIDYPEDIGHSKLDPAMAKLKFPAAATGRNWNTVLKLRDLLD